MKHISFFSFVTALVLSFISLHSVVHAALIPTYSLSTTNNNTQIQLTVLGADPNAAVMLYYPSSSSMASTNVGQTSSTGYLTTVLNPASFPLAAGAPTYVLVDGAQSQIAQWPSYSTVSNTSGTSYISLSPNAVSVQVGQSISVTATGNVSNIGTLSLSANSNSSIAAASISGSQIIVSGANVGTTNMTICASNAGCATLYVTVQAASAASNTTTSSNSSTVISFSQNTVTLQAGQSQAITMTGPGSFYVSTNSNLAVASTNVNGSTLTINALNAGTAALSVCSAGNNLTSCGTVNVTVNQSSSGTTVSSAPTGNLTFSSSNVSLNVGQKTTIGITAPAGQTGVYYVSTNSNSAAVTPNINGSNVDLIGVAFGGANISICQLGGVCGNLYAYVSPSTNTSSTVTNNTSTAAPILTSFSVSSNNVGGGFTSTGAALTITFTANQALINPTVTFAGHQLGTNGNGNGPYSAIYTMNGSESSPLSVSIAFANASGATGQASFSLGAAPATIPVSTASSNSSYTFTRALSVGSTGADVTALQNRLTIDGLYSGPITGTFGSLTRAAVKKYQAKHGLDQLGSVGPGTRSLLNQGI